jgi:hypothetical protein
MRNVIDNLFPTARLASLTLLGFSLIAISGCKLLHRSEAASPRQTHAKTAPAILPLDLTKVQPNEAGVVPILMYHDLITTGKPRDMKYPATQFRKDIQWLYDHNYRPVGLSDFLHGKVDCPAGTSPVILTFDDALRGQFNYTPDGKIDPNCAVGIMDAFHQEHPDWQTRGAFFVLTDEDPKLPPPFYQPEFAQGKLEYLVKEGYDIGNHTVHHQHMRRMSQDKVEYEIAKAIDGIHKYLPNYNVDILALPFGEWPKNESWLISGESGGTSYHNIAVLRAAWRPSPPATDKGFKPYEIERISPGTKRQQSYWWFDYLQHHSGEKYVSDGDPNTITVNQMAIGELNKSKLTSLGLHLRTYSGTQVMASK